MLKFGRTGTFKNLNNISSKFVFYQYKNPKNEITITKPTWERYCKLKRVFICKKACKILNIHLRCRDQTYKAIMHEKQNFSFIAREHSHSEVQSNIKNKDYKKMKFIVPGVKNNIYRYNRILGA